MRSVLDSIVTPRDWGPVPFGRLVERSRRAGRPDLQPLSVFLDEGVVPRASRTDNHNRLGSNLAKYLVVRPGDVVFNKLRTWQGGLGVSRYTGIVSPAYFVCRPSPRVNSRYLHYLLRSSPYLAEFTRVSKFMPPSQFDILWDDLRVLPILVPKIEAQTAIADYLDTETGRIDALISKKRRLIELLQERRRALITAAVDPDQHNDRVSDGEEPHGAAQVRDMSIRLKHVASVRTSNVDKLTEDAEIPVRLVNYVDVYYNERLTPELPLLKATASVTELARFSLHPGDVLITKDSETADDIGVAAYVESASPDMVCGYHLSIIRRRDVLAGRYLYYALTGNHARSQLSIDATGVTRFGLRSDSIRNLVVHVPSLSRQRAIADFLDTETARIDTLVAKIARTVELLQERRSALITAAVTGEINVDGSSA